MGIVADPTTRLKLSELQIDTDKDWGKFSIHNIKYVAENMDIGDIIVKGATAIHRLAPGAIGTQLKSNGPGNMPSWG